MATKQDQLPTVIYIGGYGRSGSTLLNGLLGLHPSAHAVGELNQLFINWQDPKKRCSCGERLRKCSFWQSIQAKYLEQSPGISIKQAAMITQYFESMQYGYLPFHNRTYHLQDYYHIWQIIGRAISEESGRSIVVDSSKTAYGSAFRPLHLAQAGFPVSLVMMVRDPRAVLWSTIRLHTNRLNKKNQATTGTSKLVRSVKTLAHWYITNLHTQWRLRSILDARVQYEPLTYDPQGILRQLAVDLSLDPQVLLGAINAVEDGYLSHLLDGDHVRMTGVTQIHRASESWREHLSPYQRWIAYLSYPLARTYGYDFFARKDEA